MNRHASAGSLLLPLAGVALLAACTACGQISTRAADQVRPQTTGEKPIDAIQVPEGFRAARVVAGLTYPSSMTWDAEGRLYVLESHTVPIPAAKPRILRVGDVRAGSPEISSFDELALEGPDAPSGEQAVAIEFHRGFLYLTHEQKDGTWGISRVPTSGGRVEAVLRDIPSTGDHYPNYMVFDAKGNLYFGVGSATNSGVVSSNDPVNQKWLKKRPGARDIPCRDVVLTDVSFTDDNVLTDAKDDRATTGAYQAYGSSGARSIRGEKLCTGAVYRLAPGANTPELVAWGFRNPVALAIALDGTVLVGMHGADVRGTRPILDDPEGIYRLRPGAWYGWPDYSAGLDPVSAASHQPPAKYLANGHKAIGPLFDLAASGLKPPDRSLLVTTLTPHAAVGGMDVVPPGGPFARWSGHLLVSEMGDFRPTTDATQPDLRAGFQVESIDLETGKRTVFARNRSRGPEHPNAEPASTLDLENGFERPVDVKIGPDGLVYVLDFGVFQPTATAAKILPKTGKVFRIEPLERTATADPGGRSPSEKSSEPARNRP